jgi:hypothetical protein
MATETITVNMGCGETVGLEGETRYLGTDVGPDGAPNVERYEVVILGHTVSGTWSGDARANTYVDQPGDALRQALLPTLRAQQAARERLDREEQRAAQRRFYGRVISSDL